MPSLCNFILFLTLSLQSWVSCTNVDITLTIAAIYPDQQLPQGAIMYIRGEGLSLNWSKGIAMKKTVSNSWEITLPYSTTEANQLISFKTLINDQDWMIGSNAFLYLPEDNSQVEVFPFFYSQTGSYEYIRNIYSPQLNNTRDLVIYTPPSYYENTLKTFSNILVMHDGENLFNASTSFGGIAWDCQNTVDLMVNEGNMEEIIIVGVDNTMDRIEEYTYSVDPTVGQGGKGDLYLDFLEDIVIPIIQKNYRVNIQRENLGILGSSLGGLISCYAGWMRSSTFGKAGCMSSSFWWNNEDFNNNITSAFPPPKDVIFYLDSGDSGPDNDDEAQTIRVRDHMKQLGFVMNETLFYYLDHGGQHNEYYWGHRFYVPATDLYPPVPLTPSTN